MVKKHYTIFFFTGKRKEKRHAYHIISGHSTMYNIQSIIYTNNCTWGENRLKKIRITSYTWNEYGLMHRLVRMKSVNKDSESGRKKLHTKYIYNCLKYKK